MVEMYLDIVYHCIIQEAEEDARQYVIENYTQILYKEKSKNAILQIDKDEYMLFIDETLDKIIKNAQKGPAK